MPYGVLKEPQVSEEVVGSHRNVEDDGSIDAENPRVSSFISCRISSKRSWR